VRDLVDKACIAGVGATPQGKLPGRSGDDLAVSAIREGLADAGIQKSEIDSLIVQRSFGGQGDIRDVGHRLAIDPPLAFNVGYQGEGLLTAIMLVVNGLAEVVALAYGTNQRTNRNEFAQPALHVGGNFETVYGEASPASTAAFNFRRRMHDYGATEEQLGALVVAQSKAAALNPLADYRDPLTIEDYLSAAYLIAPLRLYDFCMISDGGFANIQDPYTPSTLSMLEGYGFCERGTAHQWIQGGRIELGGELPLNVNGGQNRMTYMIGWQHTYDAVKQLRNEAEERSRQVSDCHLAMCVYSSGIGQETASVILRS